MPGAAKTPTASTANKSELQELGQRMGWDASRNLTMPDLQEMSSSEFTFHEMLNPNFAAAFERDSNAKHNQSEMKKVDAQQRH